MATTTYPTAKLMQEAAAKESATFFFRTEYPTQAFGYSQDAKTFADFYTTVPKHQKNYYEWMNESTPRRLYFDVEYMSEEEPDEEPLDHIIHALTDYINEYLGIDDVVFEISSSSGMHDINLVEVKNSFHLILKGYYFRNYASMKFVIDHMKVALKDVKGIDFIPYGKTQSFRLLGSTKRAKSVRVIPRFKNPIRESSIELIDHLATFISPHCREFVLTTFFTKTSNAVNLLPRRMKRRHGTAFDEDSGCGEEIERDDDEAHIEFEHGTGRKLVFDFFRVEALLWVLDASYYTNYQKWINVGIILKDAGPHYELLWHEFSARAGSLYDKKECASKWESFEPNAELTCRSLAFWAREIDNEAVDDIFNHTNTPIQCRHYKVTFGAERLCQIVSYIDDIASAKQVCIAFFRATCIFVLNSGNSYYVMKSGPNSFARLSTDKFDKMIAKHIYPILKQTAESYAESMVETGKPMPPYVELSKIFGRIMDKITHDNLVFSPGKPFDDKSHVINRFMGHHITRDVNDTTTIVLERDEPAYIIMQHCQDVICGSDTAAATGFFYSWLNRILNHPSDSPSEICLVLKSLPGSGKNVFVSFIQKVIGGEYCLETSEERLFSRFNSELANKILVVVNEVADNGTTKKRNDRLKDLITSPTIQVENKGADTETYPNCANFILTTNNEEPVKVDAGDRRLFILTLSDRHRGNREYFTKFLAAIQDKQACRRFLTWLHNTQVNVPWNPSNLPMTKLKQQILVNQSPAVIQFIIDKKELFENTWSDCKMEGKTFTDAYGIWMVQTHTKQKRMQMRQLQSDLKTFLYVKVYRVHKTTVIDFGSIEKITHHLQQHFGSDFKWE